MRSILTVTTAAATTDLTTLARAKAALGITGSDQDTNLERLIASASQAILTYLGRTLARETVSEIFRPGSLDHPESLILTRYPVVSITSATEDETSVDAAEYEVDAETGLLYRLNSSGGRSCWAASYKITVAYVAGYLMPGETGANLPADIEHAVIVLLQAFQAQVGRDPLLKVEEITGVGRFEYWVGSVGVAGALPPDVMARVDFYRNARVA